jgi:hypothetical protein
MTFGGTPPSGGLDLDIIYGSVSNDAEHCVDVIFRTGNKFITKSANASFGICRLHHLNRTLANIFTAQREGFWCSHEYTK